MDKKNALSIVLAFALGATTVLVAKPKVAFDPNAYYAGKDGKAAAAALLAEAEKLAGNGSWERIAVGRVAFESGDKAKGEALFNGVLSGKAVRSDLYRIATAYAVGKDWAKAKPLFERAIAMDLGDDSGIVNAACWFNLNGDRARAEELFGLAFKKNPDEFWHFVVAAGSYVGVEPF